MIANTLRITTVAYVVGTASGCAAASDTILLGGALRGCRPQCSVDASRLVPNGGASTAPDAIEPFRERLINDLLRRTKLDDDRVARSAATEMAEEVIALSVRQRRTAASTPEPLTVDGDALLSFLKSVHADRPSLTSASRQATAEIEQCELGRAFNTLRDAHLDVLRYRFAAVLRANIDDDSVEVVPSDEGDWLDTVQALRAELRVSDAEQHKTSADGLVLQLRLAGTRGSCSVAGIPIRWRTQGERRLHAHSVTNKTGWAAVTMGASGRGLSTGELPQSGPVRVYADIDWPQIGGKNRGPLYMVEANPAARRNACRIACEQDAAASAKVKACRPHWSRRSTTEVRCLAAAAMNLGRIDIARETTSRLRRAPQTRTVDNLVAGAVAVADGDFARARKTLLSRRAKAVGRSYAWYWAAVYRVRLHDGDHAGACRALRSTIALTPAGSRERDALEQRLRSRDCDQVRTTRATTAKNKRRRRKVIHFWASWCPPCVHEMPRIAEFLTSRRAAQWRRQGVEFVIINTQDTRADRTHFLTRHGLEKAFPKMVDDFEGTVYEKYGNPDLPATLVVDAQGRILHVQSGELVWQSDIRTILARTAK